MWDRRISASEFSRIGVVHQIARVYASVGAFRGAYLLRLDLVSGFDRQGKLDAATCSLDCGFVEEDATTRAIDDEPCDG